MRLYTRAGIVVDYGGLCVRYGGPVILFRQDDHWPYFNPVAGLKGDAEAIPEPMVISSKPQLEIPSHHITSTHTSKL